MANCNTCIKIHNLPECIEVDAYSEYFLVGLVFTEVLTDMIARVRNTSTGKVTYIEFTTDADGNADIDIAGLFPLMNHTYEVKFLMKGTPDPMDFTITNTDATTSTGCCIEFNVNIGQTDDNDQFVVSSQNCAV